MIGPQTREAAEVADPTDRDSILLLTQVHAEEVCSQVWGSTIDLQEIDWSWNNRFQSTAGRYTPRSYRDGPKIEVAWGYYDRHGLLDYLQVVRHELIHAWQDYHPDGGRLGHGPKFKQWIEDLQTHRHCKHW